MKARPTGTNGEAMLRTGSEHVASLRDGRCVFIDGRRVEDVTVDPAFRNAVASIAALYDFQSAPENAELMTYAVPGTDRRANRIWQLPANYGELVERRLGLEAWTELHCGFIGRAPDHVASCISGMYMGYEVFEAYDPKRAQALADYYAYARDRNLYLTYVIINPQADRSKAASEQESEFLSAGVVERDPDGITIRGAKMLATGAVLANELFVSCIQPLAPGDERYAVSFAVPLNAPGLKILSRKSYEQASASVFDNPLASRFDENDAVIYFDDVRVPWERVFVFEDIEMCQRQFHATPAHVYQNYQAMIRLSVKLRFLVGIARRIAETNGIIGIPPVREALGQLAAEVEMVDALLAAMEIKGTRHGAYFVPDRHTLYSAQVLTQRLYPKFITALRDFGGGGLIMQPSTYRDFRNPEIAGYIEETQQSPVAGAYDKVKFYKLAWDAIGSEFASRHVQYEMFYAGATFVTKAHSYRTYDWPRATELVDRVLAGYDLSEPSPSLAAVL
jgi:4-hydroxyphenylacetate 3-monooxygenase